LILCLQGDATKPIGDGTRVITHICNNYRGWGAGFVLAVSKRWPEPERAYRSWPNETFELGEVQFVDVGSDLYVANMLAQVGYGRNTSIPPIRYEALESCLHKVATWAASRNASIHMPRIGCSLAGGSWSMVKPIIERALGQHDVYVYDFPGSSYNR